MTLDSDYVPEPRFLKDKISKLMFTQIKVDALEKDKQDVLEKVRKLEKHVRLLSNKKKRVESSSEDNSPTDKIDKRIKKNYLKRKSG